MKVNVPLSDTTEISGIANAKFNDQSYKGPFEHLQVKVAELIHQSPKYFVLTSHTMAVTEEQRINACKTAASQIYTMLRSSPQQWRSFLGLARTLITQMDSTTFIQQASRTAEQVWIIAALQTLAFKDVDSGAVPDIASWCSRQWLIVIQRDPQNVSALRGLGQMWLSRAQPALARVHASQRQSSSARSSSPRSESATEAERRVGSADHMEARGYLQPATDYLERAVAAASNQNSINGDLLTRVAEAYMSLGNVSSPRNNGQFYRRALQLLQQASQVQGYTLPSHLQQYLNNHGRLYQ